MRPQRAHHLASQAIILGLRRLDGASELRLRTDDGNGSVDIGSVNADVGRIRGGPGQDGEWGVDLRRDLFRGSYHNEEGILGTGWQAASVNVGANACAAVDLDGSNEYCLGAGLGAVAPARPATADPAWPASGTTRVRRGGSWQGDPEVAAVSTRSHDYPSTTSSTLGFRLARTAVVR